MSFSTGNSSDSRRKSPTRDDSTDPPTSSRHRITRTSTSKVFRSEQDLIVANSPTQSLHTLAVIPPPVERAWEYQLYEDNETIDDILEEIIGQFEVKYVVKFRDGQEATVSEET